MCQVVRLFEVLGGQHHGGAVVDQLGDLVPELGSRPGIQTGGRLVEEQDRRPQSHAGREIEAPAHAARVRVHAAIAGGDETEALEEITGSRS